MKGTKWLGSFGITAIYNQASSFLTCVNWRQYQPVNIAKRQKPDTRGSRLRAKPALSDLLLSLKRTYPAPFAPNDYLCKTFGTFRVKVEQIKFDPPSYRDLDRKVVEQLKQVFQAGQCRRLDAENHIPATVAKHDLEVALGQAGVLQEVPMSNADLKPLLCFNPGGLRGLHGRHRIQAASEVLAPRDSWWTVDLYLDDISDELKASLIDEYGKVNRPFRKRWLAKLSRSNQARFERIKNSKNRPLRCALDALLTIPGLWRHGMRISALQSLVSVNCDNEIVNYLRHIRHFWLSLVDGNPIASKKIDHDTVDQLQSLAPGSCSDAKIAKELVLRGQVFAAFSEAERIGIWARMQRFDGLIPSLYTFFEDFKYLVSYAHCIKRLLGHVKGSIHTTMNHMFVAPPEGECLIQTSDSSFRTARVSPMEQFELGYRQVWLYAMRHYPLMPPDPKTDAKLFANSNRAKADEHTVCKMARLAYRLGFRSTEIEELVNRSPDRAIARTALLQDRKPGIFRYDPHMFELLVDKIIECFQNAIPDQARTSPENLANFATDLRMRCGLSRMQMHNYDSLYLFIDHLHADKVPMTEIVTGFFVRRCVYFSFFGDLTSFPLLDYDPNSYKPSTATDLADEAGHFVPDEDTADDTHVSGRTGEQIVQDHRLQQSIQADNRRRWYEQQKVDSADFKRHDLSSVNSDYGVADCSSASPAFSDSTISTPERIDSSAVDPNSTERSTVLGYRGDFELASDVQSVSSTPVPDFEEPRHGIAQQHLDIELAEISLIPESLEWQLQQACSKDVTVTS
ncbi:hypothetical protein P175DRAFT_0529274 [Aspergillus ochraceoroseus IBT 24754]|uniref:Uncharacterized protein n=1 Tax=Aspergillus ochraceoroseus IBT 24754 TaxID=1392256 RepID=A0A2T5M143_9EURO|nr:uncharacterized protein P175DRAFT_0529274 [Aspergillus ochraceoroseus IBT 24754]PTU22239.1 hypothetical protein P175DRAFT_0529274 [Aspergillus ochraceoroseus IBT 24754]